jgi:hypothetical protein
VKTFRVKQKDGNVIDVGKLFAKVSLSLLSLSLSLSLFADELLIWK